MSIPGSHRTRLASFVVVICLFGAAPAAADVFLVAQTSDIINHKNTGINGGGPLFDSVLSTIDLGGGNMASAFAGADLRSGTLGASSSSLGWTSAVGNAYLQDWITFDIAGADATTLTSIDFLINLDGIAELIDGPPGPSGAGGMQYRFNVAQIIAGGYYLPGASIAFDRNLNPAHDLQLFDGWTSVSSSIDDQSLSGVFTLNLVGAAPRIHINTYLLTNTSFSGNVDFDAAIRFDLPTGVTFTSQSGGFLSAAPSASVPEPSLWALLLGGLLLTSIARRRQCKT